MKNYDCLRPIQEEEEKWLAWFHIVSPPLVKRGERSEKILKGGGKGEGKNIFFPYFWGGNWNFYDSKIEICKINYCENKVKKGKKGVNQDFLKKLEVEATYEDTVLHNACVYHDSSNFTVHKKIWNKTFTMFISATYLSTCALIHDHQ